jgi:uncharacterized protein
MQSSDIQAIDIHGHYGDYHHDETSLSVKRFMSADTVTVVERARRAGITTTIVSPLSGLLPRGQADAVQANKEAARMVAETDGLLQWVIVHPLQPQTYLQADEMLQQSQCVGIKIHPEEHVYPIREQGKALFEFAARHDAVVLTHSGDPYSHPTDFVEFANAHKNITLILAHLGNGGCASGDTELQVRAIQASRHGNVYVDTSSARSLLPGLIEWAVQEIGADRILFGTDTPLYFTAMQRSRIDHSEITDQEKRLILFENARRIFPDSLIKGDNKLC